MSKNISFVLDDDESALVDSLLERYGGVAKGTAVVHVAARIGLIRLASSLRIDPVTGGLKSDEVNSALRQLKG